jgi:cytochrome c-type biogenesis protein CcmH/NrfG
MARADRRRAAREARHARHRPTTARARVAAEQQMFFPKLRGQAKWVFVFLAIVFAGGFVFLGIGSGSNLGDVLSNFTDVFHHGSSTSSAAKKAEKRVREHPKDAQAYTDLATALEADNRTDGAISALEHYRTLRPKDTGTLTELGQLYLQKGDQARSRGQGVQLAAEAAYLGTLFGPQAGSEIGQALSGTADPSTGADPVNQAVVSLANDRATKAYNEMNTAFGKAVGVYKQVAAASPKDPDSWLQLGVAAEQANDTATAITGYQQYLKLAPDAADAAAVRQHITQLRSSQTSPQTGR